MVINIYNTMQLFYFMEAEILRFSQLFPKFSQIFPTFEENERNLGIFPNLGQNFGKSILNKKPAAPYKIRICRQYLLTSFHFPKFQPHFHYVHANFFFADLQKIFFARHLSTSTKNARKKYQKIPPLKRLLLPPHLPLPTFFSYLYSSTTR